MDNRGAQMLSLQKSLQSLDLQPSKIVEEDCSDRILFGKILNSRVFRKYAVLEIVAKVWRVSSKVRIDKI